MAITRFITRSTVLGCIFACVLLAAASGPFAATPLITAASLVKASNCQTGQVPTAAKPCRPTATTVIDLSVFEPCAPLANPSLLRPCQPTVVTGRMNIAQFRPCTPREEPTWDKPCAPSIKTTIDLRWFPRCQKGEDPSIENPCRPTQANGQMTITGFAKCAAAQQPTPDKPCDPSAATKVDFSKFPACAAREKPSTARPCRPAGTRSTNPDLPTAAISAQLVAKATKSAATTKYVTLPVCSSGQRSTTAKPCIALKDNGPPSLNPPTTKQTPVTDAGPAVEEKPRIAEHLAPGICLAAGDGREIPCADDESPDD